MLRLIFLQEEHKMDSQNETAQLRYLEETSIRLRRMDFETMPAEDQQLPVKRQRPLPYHRQGQRVLSPGG